MAQTEWHLRRGFAMETAILDINNNANWSRVEIHNSTLDEGFTTDSVTNFTTLCKAIVYK